MTVIRRGNANDIDTMSEKLPDPIPTAEAGKVRHSTRILLVILGPSAGPSRNGGQLNIHQAKISAIESFSMKLFEERPIGFIKNHPQADHAGAKTMFCKNWRASHADMITREASKTKSRARSKRGAQPITPCAARERQLRTLRLALRTLRHLRHGNFLPLLHLFRSQVLKMRCDCPFMAKGIREFAIAIAP